MNLKEIFKNIVGDFSDVHWKDLDHRRVYCTAAVFLAIVVLIVILLVQVFSGKNPKKNDQKIKNDVTSSENNDDQKEPVDDNPLEVDAYKDVNDVVLKYFHGLSTGDIDLVKDVVDILPDDEIKTITTKKEYVESYNHLTCYTKKGLEEGSFVVFVSYEMKILNIETPAPGMMPLYVCKDDAGDYYIYNDDASEELQQYVLDLAAEDDIAAIINDIQVRYEEALASDSDLAEFDKKIHESQQETPVEQPAEQPPEEPAPQEPAEDPVQEETASEVTALNKRMRLTTAVRIRTERSADSDRVANGYQGEYVQAIESYSDGWSKVEYNGKTGYCQTQYLEDV